MCRTPGCADQSGRCIHTPREGNTWCDPNSKGANPFNQGCEGVPAGQQCIIAFAG